MAYQQPSQGQQGYPSRSNDPSNPFGSSTQALGGGQYSAGNSYEGGESDEYQSNQYSQEDGQRQRESSFLHLLGPSTQRHHRPFRRVCWAVAKSGPELSSRAVVASRDVVDSGVE